ncbi:hypothetical protein ONZ45_g6077 [Pleurotus djamor]|nr:hypothetical protein ONZ45_g6077 [Pleurotus djamor]
MFRPPTPGHIPSTPAPAPVPTATDSQLAASLLQAVAAQAQSTAPTNQAQPPLVETQSLTAPIHPSTNPASFHNLLKTHRAVAAFFTSATCPPCRMIEPVFERLAEEKGMKTSGGEMKGVAFTKVDMGVGLGNQVAQEWSVRVTPTFIFFLDGKKVSELKGADANELRTQVDLLVYQAYPPHPHTRLVTPSIKALSLNPILFSQVPPVDSVAKKLNSFIDSNASQPKSSGADDPKSVLAGKVAPYLKTRFTDGAKPKPVDPSLLRQWSTVTCTLLDTLPLENLFPLLDMWRLAFLDAGVGLHWANSRPTSDTGFNPIVAFVTKFQTTLSDPSSHAKLRNSILMLLRLLANTFSTPEFSNTMLTPALRNGWTPIVVTCLLHEDPQVRTAAASLAFNAAAFVQKQRVTKLHSGSLADHASENEDWELEIVSAVIEALDRETENEEVVHRLTACLTCLIRLSPFYQSQLGPLLEVLQCSPILKRKLVAGGCGANGVTKKDARALIEEVATKLCP